MELEIKKLFYLEKKIKRDWNIFSIFQSLLKNHFLDLVNLRKLVVF